MPIALNSKEWSRIGRWTNADKEDPDAVRRREYIRHLDQASRKMARDWPNSVENVNRRKEELRIERAEATEKANSKFYKKYLKRKKEDQERMMYSARDTVFKNKDAPKLLLSAVIETVIQKERKIQLDFLKQQRQRQAEQKRKDDDEIIQKAKDWHKLQAERRGRRFQVNKEHQREILEQAEEISTKATKAYTEELELQKIDNMKANEQMEAIKKFEDDFKAAEKARIWSDMERSRAELSARRREQSARDQLDDQLIHVLAASRARVEERRRRTEKEAKDEKCRIIENISSRLESGDAEREARETEILDKAIKEKEAIDDARRAALQAKEDKNRRERQEARKQFLRDEERRLADEATVQHWDMMNRFKNGELYEEFQNKLRQDKERKTQEYRAEILKLWKERSDREAREKAETRYFYGALAESKLRAADNKLLSHAAALAEEARAHGRPDRPIQRAIDRYCKMYRLYPMPELPAALQAHFPRHRPADGSRPDPGYKDEPAPPPDLGPDAPDEEEVPPPTGGVGGEVGRRDGLQAIEKNKPQPPSKTTEGPEDYKRNAPANGLQRRRSAQVDISLPPISVLPCKNTDCSCELKP